MVEDMKMLLQQPENMQQKFSVPLVLQPAKHILAFRNSPQGKTTFLRCEFHFFLVFFLLAKLALSKMKSSVYLGLPTTIYRRL